MDKLYIIVPCYNEQECLQDTATQLKEKMERLIQLQKIDGESKIVFVDDGSKDTTWRIIEDLHTSSSIFQGVKLAHNKGHQNALIAGLTYACDKADMMISIDADLQDDIEVFETMVDEFHNGNDIVYGVRTSRKKDSFFKRITANFFYKFSIHMGIDLVYNHADFRLMSKRSVNMLLSYKEVNLFLRGMVPTIGLKSCSVGYERKKRMAGVSKYPLKKMLSFAWEGITSFSIKPLRFALSLGTFFTITSIIAFIVFTILFASAVLNWSLLTYVLISIYFALGIILMILGIVGEYIGKIYLEVKERPKFIVETTLE